ncbi:MAG TPA: SH3 domain-containing protein [Kofleriaceae bacterium]|nr:SH3 domain-containing protein [Kofleriaceae bacterium]
MRVLPSLLLGLCLAAPVALPGAARAEETAWPTDNVRLRARPGETARIVARAEKDEELAIVATWGRWVKVRRGERVGWVPRTHLDIRDVEQKPRKRSRRSGFSGKAHADALEVTIAIEKVRGFDDPVAKTAMVLDLKRGDQATVIGRGHEGWILVERAGVVGWIPSSAVEDGAGDFVGDPRRTEAERIAARAAGPDSPGSPDGDEGEEGAADVLVLTGDVIESPERSGPMPRVAAAFVASVGGQTFAMRQTGAGEALATASGPASLISASARVRVTKQLWVGGDTDAGMGTASLVYANADETSQPMATRDMAVDAHACVGWGQTWQVQARAGYHYASLSIESERGESMLVGEQLGGPTVGVGGAMPVGKKIRVALGLDVMPAGALRPTELAEGSMYATSVRAAWAHSTLTYPLPARIVFALAYRGGMTSAQLTDGAPAPSTASRTDQSHTLTAGLGLRW